MTWSPMSTAPRFDIYLVARAHSLRHRADWRLDAVDTEKTSLMAETQRRASSSSSEGASGLVFDHSHMGKHCDEQIISA
jgi:hypothetical protein